MSEVDWSQVKEIFVTTVKANQKPKDKHFSGVGMRTRADSYFAKCKRNKKYIEVLMVVRENRTFKLVRE